MLKIEQSDCEVSLLDHSLISYNVLDVQTIFLENKKHHFSGIFRILLCFQDEEKDERILTLSLHQTPVSSPTSLDSLSLSLYQPQNSIEQRSSFVNMTHLTDFRLLNKYLNYTIIIGFGFWNSHKESVKKMNENCLFLSLLRGNWVAQQTTPEYISTNYNQHYHNTC